MKFEEAREEFLEMLNKDYIPQVSEESNEDYDSSMLNDLFKLDLSIKKTLELINDEDKKKKYKNSYLKYRQFLFSSILRKIKDDFRNY